MGDQSKKQVPVAEGLFTIPSSPDEKPQLIGIQCRSCGEIAFPITKGCRNCQSMDVKEIMLKRKGKIYTFSTICVPPPPPYYKGPVPFSIGWVELPDQCRVITPLVGAENEAYRIGMEVELLIHKIDEDDAGNEVMGYGFALVDTKKEGI